MIDEEVSSLCKHGELYHDCEHWECALDCIASEDEWHADIARNKIQQLQANQATLIEALKGVSRSCLDLNITPLNDFGPHPFVMVIYDIAQQAIKAVKDE